MWNCFIQDTVRTWNTFQIPICTYSFWSVFNYALCICHLPFINSVFLLSPSSSSKRIFHFVQWKPASKYFMDFMIFDVRYDVKNRIFGPSVLFVIFGKLGKFGLCLIELFYLHFSNFKMQQMMLARRDRQLYENFDSFEG